MCEQERLDRGRPEDEENVVGREHREHPFEAPRREGGRRAQDARRVGNELFLVYVVNR